MSWAYQQGTNYKTVDKKPQQLKNVGIVEKLGDTIDLTTEFTYDSGDKAPLSKAFEGDLPVLFSMVYYTCPTLCNYHLNGLLTAFKQLDLVAGRDFKVVALSMDHKESADVAYLKKSSYLDEYGKKDAEKGWYFLTGTEANIKKLTDSIGFSFKWDEKRKEYAHAAAAIAMTSKGKISRYLHGVQFSPSTLKLSVVEAGKGKVGSVIDQIVLYCFQFDPSLNKYTLYAYNIMRIGGLVTILLLALFLIPVWVRELRKPN